MCYKTRNALYLGVVVGIILGSAPSSIAGSSTETRGTIAVMSPFIQRPIFPRNASLVPQTTARPSPATPSMAAPPHSITAPPPSMAAPRTFPPAPKPAPSSKPGSPSLKPLAPSPRPVSPSASPTPTISAPAEREVKAANDWEELYEKGQALYRSGKYDEAYKVWKSSLQRANSDKVWLKESGPHKIDILRKVAMMHKTQGEAVQAVDKYNLAISTAVKSEGPTSQLVADLMLEQGRMYTFYEPTMSIAKANEMLSEAFRINEKLHGRFTIPTGDVAIALAQLKEKESNFLAALKYWQLAIDIGDRLEPNVISCCRIGPRQGKIRCLEMLGKADEAIAAHKDLIAMCRKGAPNMMSTVLSSYVSCLLKFGRQNEAKDVSAELAKISH
ncbi:MAG TPA: hypothetical protein V6C97_24050 [Oculatellaceae cyanobacterium]